MAEEANGVESVQREAGETQKIEGFDLLETVPEFRTEESNAFTEQKEQAKTEEVTVTDEEKQAKADQEAADKLAEDAKKAAEGGENNEEGKEGEEKPADTEEEPSFVSEEELKGQGEEAQDGTWKYTIEQLGYQVPEGFKEEDGFETFKAVTQAEIAKVRESSLNEGKESVFGTLKPDVRAALELANSSELSLEQIVQPTIEIDNYLRMSNEELVRAELKAANPKWTDEILDREMALINEKEEMMEHSAAKIRASLEQDKEQIQIAHTQRLKQYQESAQQIKLQERQKELDQVKQALDRVPEFLGKKLNDAERQHLVQKAQAGYLEELKSNPERLVKAMLFDTYGEKGLKYFEDRVTQKVKVEHAKHLHNVPGQGKETVANRTIPAKSTKNNFDILDKEFGE